MGKPERLIPRRMPIAPGKGLACWRVGVLVLALVLANVAFIAPPVRSLRQ
jgi:hypothetical protein